MILGKITFFNIISPSSENGKSRDQLGQYLPLYSENRDNFFCNQNNIFFLYATRLQKNVYCHESMGEIFMSMIIVINTKYLYLFQRNCRVDNGI